MPKTASYTGPLVLGEVTDETPPKRSSKVDLSQFKDILSRSWADVGANRPNPAKGANVVAEAAQIMQTRFRQAAAELGLGVGIEVIEANSDAGKAAAVPGGYVRIVVLAKPKKTRKPAEGNGNGSEAPKNVAQIGGLPKPKGK